MAGKKNQAQLTLEEKLQQALIPEAEQPYKVPANWCWTRLMFIAKWASGGTPSRKNPQFFAGNIPWVKTGELNNSYIYDTEEHISDDALQQSSAKLFPRNSILLAMYGATIGKVAILGVEAATNQACACAQCNENIYFKYVFYYLISQKKQFINKGQGGAQPNISQEIIKPYVFPLPPLAEQQRIVGRIESIFAKLDEGKENLQNVLDGFETRKAAILHKAFTGELTANWRKQYGVSMDSWEEKKLGDVTDILSSKRIYKNEYVNEGIPFFRSSEIVDLYEYGYTEPKFFISKDRYDEINKKYGVPEVGDLLVTSVGTIGKTWIVDERKFYYKDGNITQVKKNSSINMKYLNYFICSENFKKQVSDTVAGTAYNALTIIKFKNILISIPTLPEQTEIVRIIDGLLAKEQQANELSENALAKIDLIKKAILARAFRGELGTNNPADEPAIELLKRVL